MSTRLCFCPDRLHLLHLSPVSLLPQLTAQWCLDGKDSEFRVHNLNCASFLLSLISHCLVTATLRIKYSFFFLSRFCQQFDSGRQSSKQAPALRVLIAHVQTLMDHSSQSQKL